MPTKPINRDSTSSILDSRHTSSNPTDQENPNNQQKDEEGSVGLGAGEKNPNPQKAMLYKVGAKFKVTCFHSRKLDGSSEIIKCQENGQWQPPVNCDKCLHKLNDTNVIGVKKYLDHTRLATNCKEGQPTESYDPICSENYKSDPCSATCLEPRIDYGNFTVVNHLASNTYAINTVININCFPGFTATINGSATCHTEGWTELPKCVQGCLFQSDQLAHLIDIQTNSKIHDTYSMNSKIVVSCPTNMILSGKPDLTCINGTWDDHPKCISHKYQEITEYAPSDSYGGYQYTHFEFVRPIFDKMEQSDIYGTHETGSYMNIESKLKEMAGAIGLTKEKAKSQSLDKLTGSNVQRKSLEKKTTGSAVRKISEYGSKTGKGKPAEKKKY
ncbi:unnamed protein product [Gordionus sp. m RMFG-2023]